MFWLLVLHKGLLLVREDTETPQRTRRLGSRPPLLVSPPFEILP